MTRNEAERDAADERRVMLAVASFDPEQAKTTYREAGLLVCVACRAHIGLHDSDRSEATALCDGCAQEWADRFARKLNELDSISMRPNVFLNVKETHLLIQLLEIHAKGIVDKRVKWPRKLLDKLYAIWGR